MAITDSTLKAGARPPYRFSKASATSEGAGTWHSLWKVAGNPAPGANPPAYTAGSGYTPTRATTGALGQANASSGDDLRAIGLTAVGATAGTLVIYDRLWACSGFVTNSTSLQSVTTPGTLPSGRLRGAGDYGDLELWLEVYTAPGATTATWTATAADGGGTNRAFPYTHPANAESVGQMVPIGMLTPPAGTVDGVQQAVSFQCSVSSGTAGDVGLTILRPLAVIDLTIINVASFRGALDLALAKVHDDACLAFMVQCSTTNTGFISGQLGLSNVTP